MDDLIVWTVTVLLILFLFLGVSGFIKGVSEKDIYKTQCRELGGTPIYDIGGINCAKEGFIDVHIK